MINQEQQERDSAARQEGLFAWTDGWDRACRAAIAAGRMVKDDATEARKAWSAILMEAMEKQMAASATRTNSAAQRRRAASDAAAWYAALAAAEIATRPRTEKDVPQHRKPRSRVDTEMRISDGLAAGRAAWIETWGTANLWK